MIRMIAVLLFLIPFSWHRFANAQPVAPWVPGVEVPFQCSFDAADIDALVEAVNLSPEQSEQLRMSADRVWAEFADLRRKWSRRMRELDEAVRLADDAESELATRVAREEALAAVADQQVAWEEAFVDQVRLMLAEEQVPLLETFLRDRTRERYIRVTGYVLGRVDLISMVENVIDDEARADLPDDVGTAIDVVLQQFSTEVSAALIALIDDRRKRERMLVRGMLDRYVIQDGELSIGGGPPGTAERYTQSRRKLGRLERRVRDITDRDLRSLVAILPPALATRLEYEALEYAVGQLGRMVDRILRESRESNALLRKVRDLPGLDGERSEAVEQLERQLVMQRTRQNERVLEADASVRDAGYRLQDSVARPVLNERRDRALLEREAIEAKWRSSLRALLTEEEQAVIDDDDPRGEAADGQKSNVGNPSRVGGSHAD